MSIDDIFRFTRATVILDGVDAKRFCKWAREILMVNVRYLPAMSRQNGADTFELAPSFDGQDIWHAIDKIQRLGHILLPEPHAQETRFSYAPKRTTRKRREQP